MRTSGLRTGSNAAPAVLPLFGFLATLAGTQTYDPATASQPAEPLSAPPPGPHPGLLLRGDRLHGAAALELHRLLVHGAHHGDHRRLRGSPSARPVGPGLHHD